MLSFRCEVVGVGGVVFTVSLRGVFGVNGCSFWYEPEGVGAFPWLQASVGVFLGVGWYDPPLPPVWGYGGCRWDVLGGVGFGLFAVFGGFWLWDGWLLRFFLGCGV